MQKTMLDSPIFQRGSEWRRWDLHVHTPKSKLGASFVGVTWNDYVDAIETSAEKNKIAVIGVTDYMTIDGYEALLNEQVKNSRLESVDLLIPNIEFRAQPATKDGKALNIHLLIDPTDEEHVFKVKRALRQLRIDYTGPEGLRSYGCIRDELVEFARAQRTDLSDDEHAYGFGIQQFKPTYSQIIKWINQDGWLRANSLVGVANGKDGISGLPADGFGAVRDELLKSAHFIFSGNPRDRHYYLGQKEEVPPSEIIRMYGGLKPCLHGSDAHEVKSLFAPAESRNCWIKSDPTFEGLRQTLWEPEDRVHIGSAMPRVSDLSRVISNVRLSNSNGWFAQESVALNSGLVGIIGEKGAGKTAIADLIAFAAGVPEDANSKSSFITKGRPHLQGVEVEVQWAAGATSQGTLTARPYESSNPLVRYLSQDFVERLCSEDHEGQELQSAIEEVVFSHLEEVHKEDYSSFEDLRTARESASHSRQNHLRGQIATLNSEIGRLQSSLNQRKSKLAAMKQAQAQLDEVKKQLPAVKLVVDETALNHLIAERAKLKQIESEISGKNRQKRAAEEFLKSYEELREQVSRQLEELIEEAQLSSLVHPNAVRGLFPVWAESGQREVRSLIRSLGADVERLTGGDAEQPEPTLRSVSGRIAKLEQSLAKDETNRKQLIDLQKEVEKHESSVARLQKELDNIDKKVSETLARRQSDRDEAYLKYFDAIAEDERGLRDLYEPMKDKLSRLGANMSFELSTGFRVAAKDWLEKAARFFDGRKPKALAKKTAIENHVRDKLVPAWESGGRSEIKDAIDQLSTLVSPVEFMSELASPTLTIVELLDWMYSTDHVTTTYKIKYGGTALEHLSPGARGIALLVLYLLMDDDDKRPLVIDQPEGNLDNSSIYLQLVPYLKEAKKNRQIILVTHNPNLIVATDAEQVVVATAERTGGQPYPRISYTSGSLEHSVRGGDAVGIRQAVCILLEGGDRAFKEREGRYAIDAV